MAIRAASEASETSSGQDPGSLPGQVSVAGKSVTAKLSGFYKPDAIPFSTGMVVGYTICLRGARSCGPFPSSSRGVFPGM